MPILFLSHIASTIYMTGLIWFVQVVHYPLHGHVGDIHFAEYQRLHMNWTSWVVGPPMLIELGTTLLFAAKPPFGLSHWPFIVGAVMLFIVWGSTALFQVPFHNALLNVFDEKAHRNLVWSNWIRTLFWTLRSGLVLYIIYELLQKIPVE